MPLCAWTMFTKLAGLEGQAGASQSSVIALGATQGLSSAGRSARRSVLASGAHSQTMVTSVPTGANMVRLAVRSSTSPHQPATTTLRGPTFGAGGLQSTALTPWNMSPSSLYSGAQVSLAAKILPAVRTPDL